MMRLDYTLTLPGMFDVSNIQALADEFDVNILAKVIFTFTPDIIMSPLALPRDLLNRKVDSIVNKFILGDALRDVLLQLKERPNIQEMFPDDYERGMRKGKRRVLTLENIRPNAICMRDIFEGDQRCTETLEWWDSIDAG
jgi:hypothetical protein